jgi:uncharacterized phage protein gp47/JayE
MALQTPTVEEINEQIIAQLEATLNQTVPLLPKAFLRVLSKTFAAVFILLYKYAGFIFLQVFVKTATLEDVVINGRTLSPLKEWGRFTGVGDPVAATQAQLQIEITVQDQTGALAAGTQFVNLDNGVTYLLTSTVNLNAPQVTGIIVASFDQIGGDGSGAIGNLEPDDTVNFANPIPGVAREAVVLAQVITGANEESIDAYRQRIADRFQKRPAGGALIDYELWGEEAAGILNVYPYTGTLPGTVECYVEATVASSGSADGTPTAAQLAAVLASIELNVDGLASRRPANAFPIVLPITRASFDVTVFGLVVENPSATQTLINQAVAQYFAARRPYISGVTIPPRTDTITVSALTGVVEDVVTAANGFFSSVTMKETGGGQNLFVYTLGQGEKAKSTAVVFL